MFRKDFRNSSVSLPDRLRIGLFCVFKFVLDFKSETSLLLLLTTTGFVVTATGASGLLVLCALLNNVDRDVLSFLFFPLTSLTDLPRGVLSGLPSSLFLLPILLSFFFLWGREKNFSGGWSEVHLIPWAWARTLLASSINSSFERWVNGSFLTDGGCSDDPLRDTRGLSAKKRSCLLFIGFS